MRQKLFASLITACVAAWLVVGCGNPTEDKRNQGTPKANETTSAPAATPAVPAKLAEGESEFVISVKMHCKNCAAGVTKAVESVNGAKVVACSFDTDVCTVHAPSDSLEKITQAITDAGFKIDP